MYFLDDSYVQANSVLGNIEQFIHGFHVQPPELKKWNYNKQLPPLTPTPLPTDVRNAYRNRITVCTILLVLIIAAIYLHYFPAVAILMTTGVWVFTNSGWSKRLAQEKQERSNRHISLGLRLQSMIREYENPPDLVNYNKTLEALQQAVGNFKRLPHELELRRKKAEELLYTEQLDDYLWQFGLDDHSIPSIGPAKKSALYNNGIRNAAQITLLATTKVPGIGPANEQILLSWRRQMSSGFVYKPDTYKLNIAISKVNDEVSQIKLQLEHNIRREYQSLNFLKLNINNRLSFLEKQLDDLYINVRQAELDNHVFKKMAA